MRNEGSSEVAQNSKIHNFHQSLRPKAQHLTNRTQNPELDLKGIFGRSEEGIQLLIINS